MTGNDGTFFLQGHFLKDDGLLIVTRQVVPELFFSVVKSVNPETQSLFG